MKELTEVTVFTIRLLMETKVSSGGHEQEIEIHSDPHWLQCSDLLVWWLISSSGDANYRWQPDLDFTLWAAIVAFLLKVDYLNIQDTQRNMLIHLAMLVFPHHHNNVCLAKKDFWSHRSPQGGLTANVFLLSLWFMQILKIRTVL